MNEIIGRGWAFPPALTGNRMRMTDEREEISQAIAIILGTAPGERVMRPAFGCRLHELVFAPNDAETAGLARAYVEAIRVVEVELGGPATATSAQGAAENYLALTIHYEIKATHDKRSLIYPFYLISGE